MEEERGEYGMGEDEERVKGRGVERMGGREEEGEEGCKD